MIVTSSVVACLGTIMLESNRKIC